MLHALIPNMPLINVNVRKKKPNTFVMLYMYNIILRKLAFGQKRFICPRPLGGAGCAPMDPLVPTAVL